MSKIEQPQKFKLLALKILNMQTWQIPHSCKCYPWPIQIEKRQKKKKKRSKCKIYLNHETGVQILLADAACRWFVLVTLFQSLNFNLSTSLTSNHLWNDKQKQKRYQKRTLGSVDRHTPKSWDVTLPLLMPDVNWVWVHFWKWGEGVVTWGWNFWVPTGALLVLYKILFPWNWLSWKLFLEYVLSPCKPYECVHKNIQNKIFTTRW